MEKTALLLHAKQKDKVAQLAKAEQTSISEIIRRAIDAYDPDAVIIDDEFLEFVADKLSESAARAEKAIKEVHEAVQSTCKPIHLLQEKNDAKSQ